MSIDRAAGKSKAAAPAAAVSADDPASAMLEAPDAAQIARTLTEKYGSDALAFAQDRARRAVDVGDELALAAWRAVIAAPQALLRQMADA